jgi:hypothetical protein
MHDLAERYRPDTGRTVLEKVKDMRRPAGYRRVARTATNGGRRVGRVDRKGRPLSGKLHRRDTGRTLFEELNDGTRYKQVYDARLGRFASGRLEAVEG